jgi:alkyl sulfatase BDS1-like metallo-beta-lactamase superfamily hydrolase
MPFPLGEPILQRAAYGFGAFARIRRRERIQNSLKYQLLGYFERVQPAPRAAAASLFVTAILLFGCEPQSTSRETAASVQGHVHPQLAAHTAEFERKVYRVTDGVYQAVGFGLANSIMVEGEKCVFIVDVMGSVESAQAIRTAFEQITSKPIGALIYTHNHADHIFGGKGFVPHGDVDVFAHETTEFYVDRVVNILRPAITARSARMFGNHLPQQGEDAIVNAGIGPFLEIGHDGGTLGLLRPTKTFKDELDVEICGVDVKLVHAPGETNDQLFVWLSEKKVLMPGDNVYRAFPNLYTIRGTSYRDPLKWSRSIDKMRALEPDHLAPSHTRPVSGAHEVSEILTAYRDGIQYVHDQTIRGINRGLTPDQLVEAVELPPHLKNHPYLQELYGSVEWSVRSIYTGVSSNWPAARKPSSQRPGVPWRPSATGGPPNSQVSCFEQTRVSRRRSASRRRPFALWDSEASARMAATTT